MTRGELVAAVQRRVEDAVGPRVASQIVADLGILLAAALPIAVVDATDLPAAEQAAWRRGICEVQTWIRDITREPGSDR